MCLVLVALESSTGLSSDGLHAVSTSWGCKPGRTSLCSHRLFRVEAVPSMHFPPILADCPGQLGPADRVSHLNVL